jgi:hypothetical protein
MHRGGSTLAQKPPALAGGELLQRDAPVLGDGAMVDKRCLPFTANQVFNSSIASSEYVENLPMTDFSSSNVATWQIGATNTPGQMLDLKNSFLIVRATTAKGGSSQHATLALFHAFLMFSSARMWVNGVECSHQQGGLAHFNAFAQACLRYPYSPFPMRDIDHNALATSVAGNLPPFFRGHGYSDSATALRGRQFRRLPYPADSPPDRAVRRAA